MDYELGEVLTGFEGRRRYTAAEKSRLLKEAFQPGAVVSDIARRFGVATSSLYHWRQEMSAGSAKAASAAFTAVTITPEAPGSEMRLNEQPSPTGLYTGSVEIEFALGARVRITGSADPTVVATIIGELSGRSS